MQQHYDITTVCQVAHRRVATRIYTKPTDCSQHSQPGTTITTNTPWHKPGWLHVQASRGVVWREGRWCCLTQPNREHQHGTRRLPHASMLQRPDHSLRDCKHDSHSLPSPDEVPAVRRSRLALLAIALSPAEPGSRWLLSVALATRSKFKVEMPYLTRASDRGVPA